MSGTINFAGPPPDRWANPPVDPEEGRGGGRGGGTPGEFTMRIPRLAPGKLRRTVRRFIVAPGCYCTLPRDEIGWKISRGGQN
jgi:hypothetical protein